MMHYIKKLKTFFCYFVAGSSALISLDASAANGYFEARNDAMGGVGVASSNYGSASLINPALLTKFEQRDHFSILLGGVGAQGELSEGIFSDLENVLSDWSNFKGSVDKQDESDAKVNAAKLKSSLKAVDGSNITAELGAGFSMSVPNHTRNMAFAFFKNSYVVGSGVIKISQEDLDYLQSVADGSAESEIDGITSYAKAKAAFINDTGISVAKKLTFSNPNMNLSLGLNAKYQQVNLGTRKYKLNSSKDESSEPVKNESNAFNADAGVALVISDFFTFGATVKNVIARTIDVNSTEGDLETFNIRPQIVTGAALDLNLINLALDVDLSPASGFTSDKKKQFARLGGELMVSRWIQLRSGYQYDLLSTASNAVTAGFGFSPFGRVHFDIAGIFGENNTYGVTSQLAFTF